MGQNKHRLYFKIFTVGFMLCFTSLLWSQVKVMTYNLRYANPEDGVNYWEHRKEAVVELVKTYQPDILGTQEGLYAQITYLDKSLPEYSYVGVGRDDGKQAGEYTAIFFRKNRFDVIEEKCYWLSETPEVPSVGWDAAIVRILTHVVLKEKNTGELFPVFNAHFDHAGDEARYQSAKFISTLIDQNFSLQQPVLVMGDFNMESLSRGIALLKTKLNDSYDVSKTTPIGPPGTYSRFNTEIIPKRRIDYIFTRGFEVSNYQQIDDRRNNGLWISDHLPVYAELK